MYDIAVWVGAALLVLLTLVFTVTWCVDWYHAQLLAYETADEYEGRHRAEPDKVRVGSDWWPPYKAPVMGAMVEYMRQLATPVPV